MNNELRSILFPESENDEAMADFEVYLNCVSPESSSSLRHISQAAKDFRQLREQLASKREPSIIDWDSNETDSLSVRRYHQPRQQRSVTAS